MDLHLSRLTMKYIYFAFLGLYAATQCPPIKDNCGPVFADPNSGMTMDATLFSEPDFKGESTTIRVDGPFGCTNDVSPYMVRSLLSTGSTKVVLHYGRDCVGHVLQEFQGGSGDINVTKACPTSIFIKFHRYGSC
ncbi:hypothetical protein DSO57_1029753 [Entomophthora muscae]|uniref:Uncharacterized protein n=1 Tax=Entomophthora muscae TaxID=34485 RepID=A0ACC2UAQ2_9FUNG|nr:hypothetical protein DSO57_1029753 [Entomophthora muscae]